MDTAGQHEYVTFDTGFRYNKCLALTAAGDAYFIGSGSALFPCVVHVNIHEKKVGNVCVCGVCAVLCVVLLVVCVCVCVCVHVCACACVCVCSSIWSQCHFLCH